MDREFGTGRGENDLMSSIREHSDSGDSGARSAPVSKLRAAESLSEFARRLLLAILLVAAAYLAWVGMRVLLLIFAGILFAVFLSSMSSWLSTRTGLSYRTALATVVLGLLLVAVGCTWLVANRLTAQLGELAEQLPQSFERIREYLGTHAWGRLLLEQTPHAAASIAQSGDFSRVTGLVSGVSGFLFGVLVVLFVGIFGAADPVVYRKGLLYLIPLAERLRVSQSIDAIIYNLRWWLVGQLVLMLTLGVTTTLGLWLLGIPMALALGLMTGVLELIPYIGAWLSAVPAALIALLMGPGHVAMVLALYLALHILEGYVLAPLIQSRAIHLPPALTLVAQVLLGEVAGVLGLFVAAPLTVAAVVAVKMLYLEDELGDQSVEVPGETKAANCEQIEGVVGSPAARDRRSSK